MTEKDVFQNEFFEREKKVRKFNIGFKSRLSVAVCKMVNSPVSKSLKSVKSHCFLEKDSI